MTRGEAHRIAALVEEAVGPGDSALPAVRDTDAVAAFDAWLRSAPRINRLVLRGLLRAPWVRTAHELLLRVAAHCYYGDPRVMRSLGYDADAVVARAVALRAAEGRP